MKRVATAEAARCSVVYGLTPPATPYWKRPVTACTKTGRYLRAMWCTITLLKFRDIANKLFLSEQTVRFTSMLIASQQHYAFSCGNLMLGLEIRRLRPILYRGVCFTVLWVAYFVGELCQAVFLSADVQYVQVPRAFYLLVVSHMVPWRDVRRANMICMLNS